ncbi:methyltransferase RsmF C-terminal domain-like protein [Foetidibacter luteolus]|uniref:methyltransferase RsmF C-terminal domain-like protein n=1 Tax=Foetidibacter luteolus TaxID=2608880 RepID=UPI00129A7E4D|nr:RsmB/NOP family class I SAM-dependent RNA methyltransferase [Foetidibacter luteolus]
MQLPEQLLKSLETVKGFNREAFEAVHTSGGQVTSIRINPAKWPGQQPVAAHSPFSNASPVPWCPHGFYLPARPSFTLDPWLHAGMYYVQEASSMFLWQVLQQLCGGQTAGLKVLDLCAAPGGKTSLLASYFHDSLVVANEVIKPRAAILAENITKWGTGNVVVTSNDPKDFQRLPGYFDVLVVDAPCSGSGLFRRDADAIEEWSEQNVQLCSERQQRILADAMDCLKEDGILIYSTCSYSVQEDEEILDWLSSAYPLSALRCNLDAAWNIIETHTGKGAYGYRFYPDKVKGEGFFVAAFRKAGGQAFSQRKPVLSPVSKTEEAIATEWVIPGDLFFFKQSENILAISRVFQQDIALLQKNLYLRKAGVAIGAVKGKDLVPHHELSVSLLPAGHLNHVDLELDEAVSYLKKKGFLIPPGKKGWCLVKYKGAGLGWLKALPNRFNNYYPVEWRILKE